MSFKTISFFVPGLPATAGSKRAFVNKVTGKAHVVDTCKQGPSWRDSVQNAAREYFHAQPDWNDRTVLIAEEISLCLTFVLPRPKRHFRTGKLSGQLRPDAPRWHSSKPDLTTLVRALEDALKHVAWTDDCLIVHCEAEKAYGPQPGAYVTISESMK